MAGKVTLLGAGPGNPELLTVLGQRRLKEAEVIFFDRLVNPSLLALANPMAEMVDVGKLPRFHRVKQVKINELLIEYAQAGKHVVRLKAGDPYVFGRGGEEAQVLTAAGVDFEVIPGITSAIAGLAAAGIPVTHRDYASSFHIITAHHQADGKTIDWPNVAKMEGTLVFLMGMANLDEICWHLVEHGKPATTPVAVIQWATQWRQKQVIGDLATIQAKVAAAQLTAPALIVIGDVVRLSADLAPHLPLQGHHFLVPISKTKRLFHALQDEGATADFYPRARQVEREIALPKLQDYDGVAFDSIAAFRTVARRLPQSGQDLRSLAGRQILVPNAMIAAHLRASGLVTDDVTQFTGRLLEFGTGEALFKDSTFIDLYATTKAPLHLMPSLTEFDGVVFPSQASVKDFLATLDDEQQAILPLLTAYAMGDTVAQATQVAPFKQVVTCPTKTAGVIATIKEDVLHE